MTAPIDVPELVRRRALAHGVAGRRWLDDLPDTVGAVASRWGLQLGDPLPGGTASFVCGALDEAGRHCVLKVAMAITPDDARAFRRSVLAHRVADGRGCVELLHHDEAASAMLLERLGSNLAELGTPLPELLDAIVETLRAFWRPVAPDVALPTGADQAGWLAESITRTWAQLGRPCPRPVIDRAVEYCDRRAAAFDPARAVLVHGDAHGWNTLAVGDGSCRLVDPEGLRSSPEHDLAVPMREYNQPLLAGDTPRLVRERVERLTAACRIDREIDPDAVWEWGFVERVSTGLAGWRDFGPDEGAPFLAVAERCR
jgi:streptomycin 6-kinase